MKNLCPCHSGKTYPDCCQLLHQGTPAPDAEHLMRSRYSAYVLKLPAYLLDTWHADSRPAQLTAKDLGGIKWLKLEVLSHHQSDATHAEVVFVATYQSGRQKKTQLKEHSQFINVDGRWLYQGEVVEA